MVARAVEVEARNLGARALVSVLLFEAAWLDADFAPQEHLAARGTQVVGLGGYRGVGELKKMSTLKIKAQNLTWEFVLVASHGIRTTA